MDTLSEGSVTIELDPQLASRVTQLAMARNVSADALVAEAISDYLRRQALIQAGTDAWRHYQETGLHVTGEDIDAWIARLEAGEDDAEPPSCHV